MNAIEQLLADHKVIMSKVADLRNAVADLSVRGDAALPDVLPVLGRIGRMMETELALHAKKEDEGLFPALEGIFGEHDGPTHVMRIEHKEIHGQGELLRQTLHELHDIEHPQIEAGKDKLKEMAAKGGDAALIQANAEEIIRLLDMHFGKEEQILFPMALNLLDDSVLKEVGRKIETMTL